MAQNIRLKRSAVAAKVPLTTDLALGELAINTFDGKMFFKKDVSGTQTIIELANKTYVDDQVATKARLSGGNTFSDTQYFTGAVIPQAGLLLLPSVLSAGISGQTISIYSGPNATDGGKIRFGVSWSDNSLQTTPKGSIENLKVPTTDYEAANKKYVDDQVATRQASDATLTALAGVTTAADKLIYATGSDTFTTTDLSSFGRSLIDDADAAAGRTTLGAAADADVVKLTGNQTIAGVKTFTGSVESNTGYKVGEGAINTQTTGYTLVAEDNGKIITMNSSSPITLTIGTAVGTKGFSCTIIQLGGGQVTITPSGGVTLNSANGLKIAAQHGVATLFCYATNTLNVAGNLVT